MFQLRQQEKDIPIEMDVRRIIADICCGGTYFFGIQLIINIEL